MCTWVIPLSSLFPLCPLRPEAEMGEVCVQSRWAGLFCLVSRPLALGQRKIICFKLQLFGIKNSGI